MRHERGSPDSKFHCKRVREITVAALISRAKSSTDDSISISRRAVVSRMT